MWTYEQATGHLIHDGVYVATGYAGRNVAGGVQGKNNPAAQDVVATGPLPQGTYTIGAAENVAGLGVHVMQLFPSLTNVMFGRSGFFMHDDLAPPNSGNASEGCIVMSLDVRAAVCSSGDHQLEVVSGE